MTTEEWRSVIGAAGYEVSSLGRVRSMDRTLTNRNGVTRRWRGRILAQVVNKDGHATVRLGAVNPRFVHQLVLEAFVGPRPPGLVACHGPAGAADNGVANLRWDTQSSNILDAVRAGTHYARNRRTEIAS